MAHFYVSPAFALLGDDFVDAVGNSLSIFEDLAPFNFVVLQRHLAHRELYVLIFHRFLHITER